MAQISLLQFNHDLCPRSGPESWQKGDDVCDYGWALSRYMQTLDARELPDGVRLIETRHADDPAMSVKMAAMLLDAAIMFENFERNRNLPGNSARGQYEAMARDIRALLKA